MSDIEKKISDYKVKNRSKCYALIGWSQLNAKNYGLMEMLRCIFKAANGSVDTVNSIIEHLTSKRKPQGRTQVYAEDTFRSIDIIRNAAGELELVGYDENEKLRLKGQHVKHNQKIFRKSDDQVSKTFQNAEERMYNLGAKVRELYPDGDNHFITQAMQAIRKYAEDKKIKADKVVSGIEKGRYVIDTDIWRVIPKVVDSVVRRTIVINEDDMHRLYRDMEMTEYKFNSNIRKFIYDLLQDPVNAQPPLIFKMHGYNRSTLLRYLLGDKIIKRDERISDSDENGEAKTATMMVKFRCPKKNFQRKLEKLYIKLFEKNVPERYSGSKDEGLNEDGAAGGACCDGAATAGATNAVSSGQFLTKLRSNTGDETGVIRRQMPSEIQETTTADAGNYEYTAPASICDPDDPVLKRKNGEGGSVSINHVK